MTAKKRERENAGKTNKKVAIEAIVAQQAAQAAEEEEKKAAMPDKFERKR